MVDGGFLRQAALATLSELLHVAGFNFQKGENHGNFKQAKSYTNRVQRRQAQAAQATPTSRAEFAYQLRILQRLFGTRKYILVGGAVA